MKKLLLVLPGYCVGLGGLLLITYRTLLAISAQTKTITVQVNMFGEQYLDVVSLVFLWAVCLVGLLYLMLVVTEKKHVARVDTVSPQDSFRGNPDAWVHRSDVVYSMASEKQQTVVADSISVHMGRLLVVDDGTGGAFSVSVPFSPYEP